MRGVNLSSPSSFVEFAMNLLEERGKTPKWLGGQLAHVFEQTVNASYRDSLLKRLDVRERPSLMVELSRDKARVSNSKGRPLSEMEMDLFFPVAVGRALEPREFIPNLMTVVERAALASVVASGRWLDADSFADANCSREELVTALFFLDCDHTAKLFQAYDAMDQGALRRVLLEVLKFEGESLRLRLGAQHVSVEQCELVLARWAVPVALWFWTLPKAFEEGIDECIAGEV